MRSCSFTGWFAEPLDDHLVVKSPTSRGIHVLDPMASAFFQLLSSGLTPGDCAHLVSRHFRAPLDRVMTDLGAFCERLGTGGAPAVMNRGLSGTLLTDSVNGIVRAGSTVIGLDLKAAGLEAELQRILRDQLEPGLKCGVDRCLGVHRHPEHGNWSVTLDGAVVGEPVERAYLAACVFAWLRQLCAHVNDPAITLHGAALRIGDELIVLSGPSGAGKSTLCALLANTGARVYSDDQVSLSRQTLAPVALGLPITLRDASVSELHDVLRRTNWEAHIRPGGTGRYAYVDHAAQNALAERITLVFPRYVESEPLTVTRVGSSEALIRLVDMASFVARDINDDELRRLISMVRNADCYALRYSSGIEAACHINQRLSARSA